MNDRWPGRHWPHRDLLAEDGIRWEPPGGRLPRPNIVRHRHVCLDGTRIEAQSQWISAVGITFDRWVVGGYLVATSTRAQPHTVPPDFAWAERPVAAVTA